MTGWPAQQSVCDLFFGAVSRHRLLPRRSGTWDCWLVRSYSSPQVSDSARGVCYASTIVGLVVLAVQLGLWWILYQAPLWANQFVIYVIGYKENVMRIISALLLLGALLTGAFAQRPRAMDPQPAAKSAATASAQDGQGKI